MFLVNFEYNEICVLPPNTNTPRLYDWYPVVIENQEQSISDIMRYNFSDMKRIEIKDIIKTKENRITPKKTINILKQLSELLRPANKHILR